LVRPVMNCSIEFNLQHEGLVVMSTFSNRRIILTIGLIALVSLLPFRAFGAALNSNTASVTLTATMAESLTVSATPSGVTFNLVQNGTATANAPIAITTSWVLLTTRANIQLDGYFASATSALTDGLSTPDLIPTSAVLGQMTTGIPTTYTAFTSTLTDGLGSAGAGLELFTVALSAANREVTRTDNLNLEINTTSLAQLPAGTYTGTLTLQAQAL
jgi:hypothetical protein